MKEPYLAEPSAAEIPVPELFGGIGYQRIADDSGELPRGTVIHDDNILHGYPSIGRLLALERGLQQQFHAPFWMEEKVNGYNVRIARLNGRVLAFTRGGFVCPFTTDRVADLVNTSVFEFEPDLVICGEVAGPGNPYVESSPPFVSEDVRLFVFDLARWNRTGYLPYGEKMALIEQHRLPAVESFGRFEPSDLVRIRKILLRLNEQGREGVVFKEDSADNRRAKYVTSNSSVDDIRATAYTIRELPSNYFTDRVLRLVLFVDDQGLEQPEGLDRELGAAFIDGLLAAVRQFRREHKVYRTFRCRFRKREHAVLLLQHLDRVTRNVQIGLRSLERQGEYWVLEFDRTYPALNGLLGHLLGGGLVVD